MSDLGMASLCAGISGLARQNRFWSAAELYRSARSQGRQGRLGSALRGGSGRLLNLAEIEANCPVQARFAEVTVWQVKGPLPWQATVRRNRQAAHDARRLPARLLSGLRAQLSALGSGLRALPVPQATPGRL